MAFYESDVGARQIAVAYDQRLVPWLFEQWSDRLIDLAGPGPAAKAVDVACGTGLLTRTLLERLDERGHVDALDVDEAMVTYASGITADRRVSWHVNDAAQLPLSTAAADVVVCNQGLQFFPDRPAVLAEVARVLRPGGRIALGVWGALADNPWPAAMAAALGQALGDDARCGTESVCGLGDPAEVRALLEQAGFEDLGVTVVTATATHPDLRDAIDGQLAAVPNAAAIDALGHPARNAIIDDIADHLSEHTNADGSLAMPSTSILATGVMPG